MAASASIVEKDFSEYKEKSWAELCEEDDSNDTVKNVTAEDDDDGKLCTENENKDTAVNFRTFSSLFKSASGSPGKLS